MNAELQARKKVQCLSAQPVFPTVQLLKGFSASNAQLSNAQLLSNLKPQQKMQPPKQAEVHENAPLQQIAKLFEESLETLPISYDAHQHSDYGYGWACTKLKSVNYTPEDVSAFCFILEEHAEHRNFIPMAIGFLNGLINCGKADVYALNLSHIPGDINGLGQGLENKCLVIDASSTYNNIGKPGKNGEIIFKGNVIFMPGDEMKAGKITVEGNVFADAWSMPCGGTVIIKGSLPRQSRLNPGLYTNLMSLKISLLQKSMPLSYKINAYKDALKTIAQRFSSTAKIYHKDKLVYSHGLHGIPLYIMHPLMAMQGKLERW